MTAPIASLSGLGQETLLTDRVTAQAQRGAAPVVEQVVGKLERPLDKVELKSNYINDIHTLRAAGPGVPLFESTQAPGPAPAGRTTEPVDYKSSGKNLLVDAFG